MIDACNTALKEWNATISALETGRQILLLRKGGLLDPDGAFNLEYSRFWLAPTRFHQDETLVKPDALEFLKSPPSERGVLSLQSFARVEKAWPVAFEEAEKLTRLEHIWSPRWLETRFDYQPEKPIYVVALRIFVLPAPHIVEMQPEYSGCRSWIELQTPLSTEPSTPALDDAAFQTQLAAAARVLGS